MAGTASVTPVAETLAFALPVGAAAATDGPWLQAADGASSTGASV